MELCTRTFTSPLLFNLSLSLPSSNSVLLLRANTRRPFKFNSIKLSSFTSHNINHFQPLLYHHSSSPFTVSASSSSPSVSLGTENDPLPADLNVTETAEPNSKVCSDFTYSFLQTSSSFIFSVWKKKFNLGDSFGYFLMIGSKIKMWIRICHLI